MYEDAMPYAIRLKEPVGLRFSMASGAGAARELEARVNIVAIVLSLIVAFRS
jgi:hypothetical protein